jgi:hypothetical protein
MATENIFLGPLSERLVSALALEEGAKLGLSSRGGGGGRMKPEDEEEAIVRGYDEDEEEDVDAEGEEENDEGGVRLKMQQGKVEMDAVDLEERIKRELRFIGLLPEEEVSANSSLSFSLVLEFRL